MFNFDSSSFQRATMPVAVACILPLFIQQSHAAVDEAGSLVLEEVIVTAEKRAVSLQDTALSVSAFTGDTLEGRGVLDAAGMASFVPNLAIGDFGGAVVVNIRGIQTNDTTETSDPSVAFHVDGVYQGRPRGAGAQFYDLERVEVLRGPQGTLYGRNATAGSLNVITNKPTDEFGASLEAIAGDYDRIGVRGMINLPAIENTLSFRAAYYSEDRDGYAENDDFDSSIDNANDEDAYSVRLHTLYTPNDDVTVLLSGYYYETDSVGSHWVDLARADNSDLQKYPLNTQPVYDADQWRVSMEASWDLGDWVLTYLPSYQEDTINEQLRDLDGTNTLPVLPPFIPPVATFGPFNTYSEQTSHELRVAWDGDGAWQGLIGLYYFDEEQATVLDVVLVPNALQLTFDQYDSKTESTAIFTDLRYDLSDTWQLTGGLRYTDDEKHRFGETRGLNLVGAPIAPPGMSSTPNQGEVESDSTDWKLGLNWTPSDSVLYYALAGTGYKQGGFNSGIDLEGYDPEEVTNYEVGSKLELWDGRARLNISAFLMDYTDLQVSTVEITEESTGLITKNAAESTNWGFEVEGLVLVSEAFEIDYSLAYLNAEFDEFDTCDPLNMVCGGDAAENVDLAGNNLSSSPEWTMSLGLQYRFALGDLGSLTTRLQSAYVDEYYIREFNTDLDTQDSYTKTDLFVTYRTSSERFLIEAFVKNIEDEDVINNGLNVLTFLAAQVSPPRTYGIRAAYTWD
jgi:iron complex outermembrane receptor protein